MTDSTRALIPQQKMFGGPSEPLVMQDLAAADPGAPATRDVTRLSEAAHKLCGLLSAFSTAAAAAASDLEEIAARCDLDEARPLVERLETMGRELILGLEGLTLETQPRRAAEAGP
jgi:hypothetical protein